MSDLQRTEEARDEPMYGTGVDGAKARRALAVDIARRGDPYTENCIIRLLDCIALLVQKDEDDLAEAQAIAHMGMGT